MTTNTQSFFTKHVTSHLMDYRIQKINRQIQDFIHVNQEIDHYHFDVCPKCGKKHPRLIKAGLANSGKQMRSVKTAENDSSLIVVH